jgi:preprotein translocase subunit SecD
LSQPYNGIRWVEVVDAGGGLIRLTPTEAALDDRERQVIRQAVSIMRVRMLEGTLVNASVEPEGARRILLQAPGFSLRQVTQVMFP